MMQERAISSAQRLGYAGLIPFLVFTMGGLLDVYADHSLRLFVIYSALILSFLGGVHWGLAMARDDSPTRELRWSMLPTIVGLALLFAGVWITPLTMLIVLAFAHLFWLNFEKRHVRKHLWYIELRSRLTFTVVALHVILIIISL
ncbi:DUF3429 domain-containing protein [Pseudidiomarina terrestris]|uniref:DUF3429 domain-containing protein n=1 Tax=Pseudidiomarina terrestris TaxID=2820060 RepID=UPI00264D6D68|nr:MULTISPECIES: DUF3429 domain-containing protein [unclassified Pseudidiomarina]MDN7126801.1 DUF3429 domain-containing protein [Pseudidiomarina sp. 1APR75-33.1]MDN7134678.1 DUF3429 domain-containing protein [Pseudidiomarina sp. 1ASP75-5]MDN7136652.1 DUF3429 domain-containing protein [Pseudidiomarina sp. 1ASP75-14]